MDESRGSTWKSARHWAIPFVSLSVLIATGALTEAKSIFWLPAGLLLVAAIGQWTHQGTRRFFALDQFFGAPGAGPSPGFWISMAITAAMLLAAGNALGEFVAEQEKLSAQAAEPIERTPVASPGDRHAVPQDEPAPIAQAGDRVARMRVLDAIHEGIGTAAKEVTAALDEPALSQARYEELMVRLDMLESANYTIGCQLFHGQAQICNGQVPIEDDAEWGRVYTQVLSDSQKFLAPL